VVDDFDGDAAGFGFVEGAGGVAVECGPGFGVDLGFEGGFERGVGVVLAEEVGVAHEEALAVVVGVEEPAGDAFGAVAADFASGWIEDIDAVYLDAQAVAGIGEEFDVGLAEDDEEVAFAGGLEVVGHVEVGVHAGFEHGDAAEFVEFSGVGLVVEGAGDEDIEACVARFPGGVYEVWTGHRAELGADEDTGAALGVAFHVAAFGADEFARPAAEREELDAVFLVRLLDSGGFEVFEDHVLEGSHAGDGRCLLHAEWVDEAVVLIHTEHAVGAEALDGEGTCHADFLFVLIGLVVEVFELGLGGDAGIDFLLAGNAGGPPSHQRFVHRFRRFPQIFFLI